MDNVDDKARQMIARWNQAKPLPADNGGLNVNENRGRGRSISAALHNQRLKDKAVQRIKKRS